MPDQKLSDQEIKEVAKLFDILLEWEIEDQKETKTIIKE